MIGYYEPYWDQPDKELEHFGVKGMKWGVRRYQNADGTLTEAGKKRMLKLRTREINKRLNNLKTDAEKEKYARSIYTYVSRMTLKDLERASMSSYERAKAERNEIREASDAIWKVEKLKSKKASPEKIAKYAEKAKRIIDKQYEQYARLSLVDSDFKIDRSEYEDIIRSYNPPKWSKKKK